MSEVPQFGDDIRKEFMLRDNSVFLNHGSYGSMPRCVHERQISYLLELESHPDNWFRFNMYKYLAEAVTTVADFMGIMAEDTFLLQNVTKAVNTVLKSFPLESGDAILITTLTYGAVKKTSYATASRVNGAKVYELDVQFPLEGDDQLVELYETFLSEHTDVKLAVVDHITSPTAIILPTKRLTELCHSHGIVVIVDGAHVPGQLAVDIQDIDADFYTGNMHKWVYCPRACAFLWMNPARHHDWLKPLVTSAFCNDGLQKAFAYEGTKDDTPYICTIDGIRYYRRLGGMSNIVGYNSNLLKRGVAYLEEKWGTTRLSVPEYMEAPNLRLMHLPDIPGFSNSTTTEHALNLQKLILDMFDIQTAVVILQGKLMIRLSAQVYNTMNDFHKLGDAVSALVEERVSLVENAENV